jgi:hypothetical protein
VDDPFRTDHVPPSVRDDLGWTDDVADVIPEYRMIGKISAPRGQRIEPLIYYLYGPGRYQEHTDPHIVAGWRHPAELEPPLREDGGQTSGSCPVC